MPRLYTPAAATPLYAEAPRVRSHRPLALLLLCSLLAACATAPGLRRADWPAQIPPRAFFVKVYAADEALQGRQSLEEYLSWVVRFYSGTALYPRGWSDLVAEQVAAETDADTAMRRRTQLQRLGREIAAEWAKDNALRRVDTRHLVIWGEAARRAIREGNVEQTLSSIEQDLEQLMSGVLEADAITAARYHEPDPDDVFTF
jgi:hypothetical protein